FLGAENDGAGRTGFDTGRLLPHGHPVGAQVALIGFVVFLGYARDIEGTARYAIAAAYAVFLMKVDDAVVVLDDGAWSRTGFQAARVFAVHAAVFADQPF